MKAKMILAFFLLAPLLAIGGDNPELRSLKDADQEDRQVAIAELPRGALMTRDKKRRERVLEILKSGQVTTAWDYFNAALVLQHGGSPEEIRLAHSLTTIAVTLDPEHKGAKWLMASSWDRLMVRFDEPQWYGTQSMRDEIGKFVLYPVDPDAVSDADRAAHGVPSLMESQAKIERRNEHEGAP